MTTSCPERPTFTAFLRWMRAAMKACTQRKPPKPSPTSNNGVVMRFCRFDSDSGNAARYGLIETTATGDVIRRTLDDLPTAESDFERGTAVNIPLASVRLLAPI